MDKYVIWFLIFIFIACLMVMSGCSGRDIPHVVIVRNFANPICVISCTVHELHISANQGKVQ